MNISALHDVIEEPTAPNHPLVDALKKWLVWELSQDPGYQSGSDG